CARYDRGGATVPTTSFDYW
nr:immunoglobulin heavy chain junction region [Macaca mulatta]